MTSASQWKRCFTNPDSWMKWNIFRALFLGLELAGSPQPHIQGHPTPHLSVTHGEQGKTGFSCKNVGAFWPCHAGQSKSQTPPERVRDFSRDFMQLLLVPWEFSLVLVLPKGKQQILHPNPGDTRRGHWRCQVVPTAPLAHPGLGSSPLWQGNSTPSFLPAQKFWE